MLLAAPRPRSIHAGTGLSDARGRSTWVALWAQRNQRLSFQPENKKGGVEMITQSGLRCDGCGEYLFFEPCYELHAGCFVESVFHYHNGKTKNCMKKKERLCLTVNAAFY